jgi:glutamate N-acetyltransferase/amino-acid N-acetyltransferase
VIGEPLDPRPRRSIWGGWPEQTRGLLEAARAIMTTDTSEVATLVADRGGDVVINGIAKGAGMIAPDMATMLSFIFTDAPIGPAALQESLHAAMAGSFNAITIDGDTSTSDTVLAFATGRATARGVAEIEPGSNAAEAFAGALAELCRDLAHQVVRDGEGVTKFVEVTVMGATSDASAKRIAASIANSPLVKTALAGEDANWGRVVMAVGKAGEPADRDRLSIHFGDHRVAHQGERDPTYSEAGVSAYMKSSDLAIRVDLGLSEGTATMWTCDLTAEYVAINADYRS